MTVLAQLPTRSELALEVLAAFGSRPPPPPTPELDELEQAKQMLLRRLAKLQAKTAEPDPAPAQDIFS